MNTFEKMYNSTLKYIESMDSKNSRIGGFIDTNDYTPNTPSQQVEKEYSKMDPVAIYRNNKSLKNVPYDVNKVKYLVERTHPASERFDSFIKKANNKASIDTKRYNNFLNWIDTDLRKVFWNERCPSGVQRVRVSNDDADLANVYRLIDFDNRIVYNYVYMQKDGKYTIVGSSAKGANRTKDSNIPVNITDAIISHNTKDKREYIKDYRDAENAFFEDQNIKYIFMNPQQFDIIERGNFDIAHMTKKAYANLIGERDINAMPELRGSLKEEYKNYVMKEEENIREIAPDSVERTLEENGVITPEQEKKE